MSFYPEHLNPFAEDVKKKHKTLKISNFRDFKNTLRRSFRGKSRTEDEVEIRRKERPVHLPAMASPPVQRYTLPPALPRSRFQERLSQSQRQSYNPFDEEPEHQEEVETPKPKARRKKRAPLPPKSTSSQDVSTATDIPATSQWSLNSDYSEMDSYNVDDLEVDRLSLKGNFSEFTKEMEKLTDDSNNNNSVVNNKEVITNIPDVIVSCPAQNDSINNDEEEQPAALETITEQNTLEPQLEHSADIPKVDNHTITEPNTEPPLDTPAEIPKLDNQIDKDKSQEPNSAEPDIVSEAKTEAPKETATEEVEPKSEVPMNGTNLDHLAVPETSSETESDTEDLVVKDITHNMIESTVQPFQFNENKSIYIGDSLDQLNNTTYTDSVSIYVTNSKDQLDVCNNNNEPFKKDGFKYADDEDETMPQPKQRKNKPSRSNLLGI